MKPIALASPEGLLKCRITAPTPNLLNLHINKICQVMGVHMTWKHSRTSFVLKFLHQELIPGPKLTEEAWKMFLSWCLDGEVGFTHHRHSPKQHVRWNGTTPTSRWTMSCRNSVPQLPALPQQLAGGVSIPDSSFKMMESSRRARNSNISAERRKPDEKAH